MKTSIKLLAVVAVLALAFVPLLSAEGSDAAVVKTGQAKTYGFDDTGSGTLEYTLQNDAASEVVVTIKVTEFGNPDYVRAEQSVTVPNKDTDNGTVTVYMHFGYGSSGTKWVDVTVYDAAGVKIDAACENSVEISVSHSIWKDSTTYIVIVVIVIVIIIAIVLYMRSTKKTKADTTMADKTFTKMYEEKKAKKAPAKTAEKKEYKSSGNRAKRK